MLSDPLFYLVCIPAVMLFGIAKGGFGGSIAVLAVPLMALVMPPTQAAAILLPILVVMDVFVLRTYWGSFDRSALKLMLPGAMLGIGLGYISADAMNDQYLRVLIGVLALGFGLQNLLQISGAKAEYSAPAGAVFGALAGFTSFSIHAGGPPFQMYLIPKKLAPLLYAGTAGMFFAVVNFTKLFPYYALGQLSGDNLGLSLIFLPLAPLGVAIGHWLVKRTEAQLYYRIISFFLIVVGVMLLWEGLPHPW